MMTRTYYKQTRLEHYHTFCQAAVAGSFSAAAAKLGLSRSTVWQQILTLERELNVALFQRSGRSMQLTDNGRRLLELTQGPTTALESVPEQFAACQDGSAGVLRLAMLPSIELLPAIVAYRRQRPQTRLVLFERRSLEVLDLVEQGIADLGFALQLPGVPRRAALQFELISEREFGLTLPLRHPLFKKKRLLLADLVTFPLILGQPDNPMRRRVDAAFQRAGLTRQRVIAVETDDRDCVVHCVRLGLGIGIGTYEPDRAPPAGIRTRSLDALLGSVPLGLFWRRGSPLAPACTAFRHVAGRANRGDEGADRRLPPEE